MLPARHVELFLDRTAREFHLLRRLLDARRVAVTQEGQEALALSLGKACDWATAAFRAERGRVGQLQADAIALGERYRAAARDIESHFISYVGITEVESCPPEVSACVSTLIRSISPRARVILYPSPDPVPQIAAYSNLEHALWEALGGSLSIQPIPPPGGADLYVFLSYPAHGARSHLLLALLASHEVLHLRDIADQTSAQILSTEQTLSLGEDDLLDLVRRVREQPLLGGGEVVPPLSVGERFSEDEVRALVLARWGEITASWIAELVADLLATRLYGPVYFLAFADYSLGRGIMDTHADSHPRSRLRLLLMLEDLRELRFAMRGGTGQMRLVNRQLAGWRQYLRPDGETRGDIIHATAEKYVHGAFHQLRAAVASAVIGKEYTAARFIDEVDYLVDCLKQGFPPAQVLDTSVRTATPASLAGILTAAWLVESEHADAFAKVLAHGSSPWSKLDDLVLKAVELREIHSAWRSVEGSQQNAGP